MGGCGGEGGGGREVRGVDGRRWRKGGGGREVREVDGWRRKVGGLMLGWREGRKGRGKK